MVAELTVENLAIIDRSRLELGAGLTVLTGETGAGKSLLIDAIELVLGERADSDLVRAGAKSATVSVVFNLSASPTSAAKCEEMGFELEDGALYITRDILAEGRSQCRIQGKPVPVSILKGLGQVLVDLHGQHDHQSLLFPERHLGFLDEWIGPEADTLSQQVQHSFGKVHELRRQIDVLRANVREREHKLDLLRHQVSEIEAVAPQAGEFTEIESQLSRLEHAERIVAAAAAARAALSEQEGAAIDLVSGAVKQLADVSRFDPQLQPPLSMLNDAMYQLDEAIHAIGRYSDALEADPELLEELATRLDSLKKLRRKYGDDEAAVLAFLIEAREQLATLENAEAVEGQLDAQLSGAEAELQKWAEQLSRVRQEKSSTFASLVEEQLGQLALERARLTVQFKPKAADATGIDEVEFQFTANPGEPLKPLSRIASGGEMSRLMLALKTVLAGKAGVPTLIFDEIDTGLGGRVAATVGRKLEQLSASYQVLVISHLPQVAARASTHFKIQKVEESGRTVTRLKPLLGHERVEEIARMLGGEALTEAALANAAEMLGIDRESLAVAD